MSNIYIYFLYFLKVIYITLRVIYITIEVCYICVYIYTFDISYIYIYKLFTFF